MEESYESQNAPPQTVNLILRGTRFSIQRESLMELPESVLLCLFPNGIVLNPQRANEGEDGEVDPDEEDVYYVDFDGLCLDYILKFFEKARWDFYEGPARYVPRQVTDPNMNNPLFHKQAIICLREELEFYAIPPKPAVPKGPDPAFGSEWRPEPDLLKLKGRCGSHLLERKSIFTALQRNVNRENNLAEQHLIDMLCMSGFSREDEWGFRALEPDRCCITSIALVLLKTGIVHGDSQQASTQSPSPQQGVSYPQVNTAQLATAQKLLLFWRKPARKCWWDASDLELQADEGDPALSIKVWARRVWTLELSLV